jgi:hypothetical protein
MHTLRYTLEDGVIMNEAQSAASRSDSGAPSCPHQDEGYDELEFLVIADEADIGELTAAAEVC